MQHDCNHIRVRVFEEVTAGFPCGSTLRISGDGALGRRHSRDRPPGADREFPATQMRPCNIYDRHVHRAEGPLPGPRDRRLCDGRSSRPVPIPARSDAQHPRDRADGVSECGPRDRAERCAGDLAAARIRHLRRAGRRLHPDAARPRDPARHRHAPHRAGKARRRPAPRHGGSVAPRRQGRRDGRARTRDPRARLWRERPGDRDDPARRARSRFRRPRDAEGPLRLGR